MDIERIEKEIYEQTRNGREEVYICISDIQQLEKYVKGNSTLNNDYSGIRIFIKTTYIKELIREYKKKKFKEDLKVDSDNIEPTIVTNMKKIIEQEKEK